MLEIDKNIALSDKSIFNKKLEVLNNFVPIVFIAIALIDIWLNYSPTKFELVLLKNISHILLFNSLHVIFTYIFLFCSKDFINFIQEEKENNNNLKKKWIIISSAFFLLVSVVHIMFLTAYDKASVIEIYTVYSTLYGLFAIYHGATQSYGISSIYNTIYSDDYEKRKKINRWEKSFWLLATGFSTLIIGSTLVLGSKHLMLSLIVYMAVLTILYCFIMLLNFRASKSLFKSKYIFFLRYILYPLNILSPAATAGLNGSHGIENVMVSEKIFKNGQFVVDYKKWYLLVFFIILLVAFLMNAESGLFGLYTVGRAPLETWYAILMIISNTAALTHFYIESDMYKFRNSSVIKNQGRLILKIES